MLETPQNKVQIVPEQSENPEPRRVGYARVSTADQNLDMQIEALKRYGVPEGMIITDKMSGTVSNRPGLTTALKMAQHEGTEFVVWKLDRLGRSIRGIIETMQIFEKRGVRLVSITERFDLSTPFGKAILHFLAVFAELERDLIRERTMAGLQRAKERGDPHGRPRAMTPEREALGDELLRGGYRGASVWKRLQAMPGPKLSRSAYFAWQQLWDFQHPADDLDDLVDWKRGLGWKDRTLPH